MSVLAEVQVAVCRECSGQAVLPLVGGFPHRAECSRLEPVAVRRYTRRLPVTPDAERADAIARARLTELLRRCLPEARVQLEDDDGIAYVGLHNAFARNALRDALGPNEEDDPETARPGTWEQS